MRNRIEALARHIEMKKNSVIIDYSEYNRACEVRKALPKYVLKKIDECVKAIVKKHPDVVSIKLIGSYSNGAYIDEKTSKDFVDMKRATGARLKISDFDFKTDPVIIDQFVTKNGHNVHLWVSGSNNESLTWEFK